MLEMIKNVFGFGKSATDYKLLKEQGALIVDVRSKQEFNQGHYRKALNIPLDQIGREIPKLKKKNKVIITCCLSGARSGAAKRQLEAAGIEAYNGGNWSSLARKLED